MGLGVHEAFIVTHYVWKQVSTESALGTKPQRHESLMRSNRLERRHQLSTSARHDGVHVRRVTIFINRDGTVANVRLEVGEGLAAGASTAGRLPDRGRRGAVTVAAAARRQDKAVIGGSEAALEVALGLRVRGKNTPSS